MPSHAKLLWMRSAHSEQETLDLQIIMTRKRKEKKKEAEIWKGIEIFLME